MSEYTLTLVFPNMVLMFLTFQEHNEHGQQTEGKVNSLLFML